MAITKDEFLRWRNSPVSEWVFAGVKAAAEAQKQGWIDKSWEAGMCDPLELMELRSRADALGGLAEADYADWCGWTGQEPIEEA